MSFLVMGIALLISVLCFLVPLVKRVHSLRDSYLVIVTVIVLMVFSLGLIVEGAEQLGWTR